MNVAKLARSVTNATAVNNVVSVASKRKKERSDAP
jgi:hypothetical protein